MPSSNRGQRSACYPVGNLTAAKQAAFASKFSLPAYLAVILSPTPQPCAQRSRLTARACVSILAPPSDDRLASEARVCRTDRRPRHLPGAFIVPATFLMSHGLKEAVMIGTKAVPSVGAGASIAFITEGLPKASDRPAHMTRFSADWVLSCGGARQTLKHLVTARR